MDNKKVYIIALVLLCFIACAKSVVEKPKNLIPKDVMIDIYYDISILNSLKSTGADKLESIDLEPDAFLYEKYSIDSAQLANSSIYYTSNANLQLEMFVAVEERLQRLKDTVDARRTKREEFERVKKAPAKKAPEKKATDKKS